MLVSIILPTLNGGLLIRQAVDNILLQNYSEIELIIIDGGSTDNTIEIINSYDDPRIALISQRNNEGRLPGAINLGLENSHGDFLTWTSDDNVYTLDAIKVMAGFLEMNPDVDFVYSNYWRVDENLAILSEIHFPSLEQHLLQGHNGPCFLFRNRVFYELGGQDITVPLAADFEYWLRVWKKNYRIHHLPVHLYKYREQPYSLSSRLGGEEYLRDTDKALEKWVGSSQFKFPSRYHRLVGNFYISQAYEKCNIASSKETLMSLIKGIQFDPRYLQNRGVLIFIIRKFLDCALQK